MRIAFCTFFCIMLYLMSQGQDTAKYSLKTYQVLIQAEGFYKNFFGKRYIEPIAYNSGDQFEDHQYENFSKVPTYGFSVGLLFKYKFDEYWGIGAGLLYFFRKDIYERNQDDVIKYGNSSNIRDIHNLFKYDYLYYNIELPFLIQYMKGKMCYSFGVQFPILTYKKANYSYLVNQFPQNPEWVTSDKELEGYETHLIPYPTLQLSCNIRVKDIVTSPFIGFEYGISKQKSFCTQVGINLPIINWHSKK